MQESLNRQRKQEIMASLQGKIFYIARIIKACIAMRTDGILEQIVPDDEVA